MSEYCAKEGLKLEVCDTANVDQTGKDVDYPAWQRKTRYAFFVEMYKKYSAAALFISHMMQLRGLIPHFFSGFPGYKKIRAEIAMNIKSFDDLEKILAGIEKREHL